MSSQKQLPAFYVRCSSKLQCEASARLQFQHLRDRLGKDESDRIASNVPVNSETKDDNSEDHL